MVAKTLRAAHLLMAALFLCHPALAQAPPDEKRAAAKVNRYGCLGTCPVYDVEIHADGRVTWRGRHYVAHKGTGEAHVDATSVSEVFAKLFPDTDSKICANPHAIDAPEYYILFSKEGDLATLESIRDAERLDKPTELTKNEVCDGRAMKQAMAQLEQLAQVHHWIYGNPFIEFFARHRHKF